MSRSQKKHPLIQCCGDKGLKIFFNRNFRHQNNLDFPSGSAYRKVNKSWEICDVLMGYFTVKEIPNKARQYRYSMK